MFYMYDSMQPTAFSGGFCGGAHTIAPDARNGFAVDLQRGGTVEFHLRYRDQSARLPSLSCFTCSPLKTLGKTDSVFSSLAQCITTTETLLVRGSADPAQALSPCRRRNSWPFMAERAIRA